MKSKPNMKDSFRFIVENLYGPVTDNQLLDKVKQLRDHIYKRKCEMPVVATRDYPIDPDIDMDYQLSFIMEFEMRDRDREYQKLKDLDDTC
jgi:hypothetical protein